MSLTKTFSYLLLTALIASPTLANAQMPSHTPEASASATPSSSPSPKPTHSEKPNKPAKKFEISTHRYAGNDRYGTAIALSKELYKDHSQETIILASGEQFPDAVTAANLFNSGKPKPVLLSPRDQLTPEIQDELKRVSAEKSTVVLIGGEKALSPAIEPAIKALGFNVKRVSGENRIATALRVASPQESKRNGKSIVVTPADDGVLSLLGASYALQRDGIHLLAGNTKAANEPVTKFIQKELPSQSTTLGPIDELFAPKTTVDAIHSDNPFFYNVTNCYIEEQCMHLHALLDPGPEAQTIAEKMLLSRFGSVEHVVVIAGKSPVDGIAATQLAAKYNAPIIPLYPDEPLQIGSSRDRYGATIKRLGRMSRTIHLVGGAASLPKEWETQLKQNLEKGLNP